MSKIEASTTDSSTVNNVPAKQTQEAQKDPVLEETIGDKNGAIDETDSSANINQESTKTVNGSGNEKKDSPKEVQTTIPNVDEEKKVEAAKENADIKTNDEKKEEKAAKEPVVESAPEKVENGSVVSLNEPVG